MVEVCVVDVGEDAEELAIDVASDTGEGALEFVI